MKKTLLFSLMLGLILALGFSSCSKDEEDADARITMFNFTSPVVAIGIIDEDAKTITVNVPFGTDLSNVLVEVVATEGATITPDPSSGIDFTSMVVDFDVTVGSTTNTYTVTVIEGENPLQLILIGDAPTLDEVATQEIKTAYEWAKDKYQAKAKYISFADLTQEDLDVANAIWWHQSTSPRTMPPSALDAAAMITDYYKNGGNLLLTTHATGYLVELGRLTADWGPTGGGDGPDANPNPDNWGMSFLNEQYADGNGDHPLFEGLTLNEVTFGEETYDAAFLIDGGLKRDHSWLWDFNVMPVITDAVEDPALRKDYFEEMTNSVVRGSFEWDPADGKVDLGTVIEFNPDGDYDGTTITISKGAYEWYQSDDRTNQFRGNIETLTSNALELLGVE
ncbi:MAG: DUF4960 domain-containing protein [Bacteroidota bacterium]